MWSCERWNMRKGINISHVNIENMGGRDQSQVKNKKFEKIKFVPRTYQKVITMTWRTGWWFRMQWLTLLLAAHARHGLLWSSLPLPQDLSVHWLDKPQIFLSHSDPKPFGVWCYFYLHLTHLCSIFVTPLSSDPPLSPIAPLWFPVNPPILCDSESSYSFYSYLPPMSIIGHGLCARPALIMYVYKRLVSAVGIPQTWNWLGYLYCLSSLQQP